MLRFHLFTGGKNWTAEYCNPDEEAGFRVLIRYSPLHTVPDADKVARFPAVLVTTGERGMGIGFHDLVRYKVPLCAARWCCLDGFMSELNLG